ncbi:MAG: hypothetical protein KGI57_08385, partial [Hyphomicrobiales bacterium]|nr:hypothetical protein [Hyphomicrobiales bacterium]
MSNPSNEGPIAAGGAKPPAAVVALWAVDGAAPADAATPARTLRAVAEAAAAAYPGAFARPTVARVVVSDQDRLSTGTRASFEAAGVEVAVLPAPRAFCATQADIAIVADIEGLANVGDMPALLPGPDGGALYDRGGPDPIYDDRPRAAPRPSPADPARIAADLFAGATSPELLAFHDEPAEIGAGRFSYDLLLRLLRAPTASAFEDDGWAAALALGQGPRADAGPALRALEALYRRADSLAVGYGRRWRSTLVARSVLLVATGAISGVVGAALPDLFLATFAVQLATSGLLLLDRRVARKNRWRARWVEYRALAESLRGLRALALGGAAAVARPATGWIDFASTRALRAVAPWAP